MDNTAPLGEGYGLGGKKAKPISSKQMVSDVAGILQRNCPHDMRPMYHNGEFITGARCAKCGYTEWM